MIAVGKKAPAFTLQNQDGRKVKLSDYKGRTVVLFAFPRANTGGCTKQAVGLGGLTPLLKKHDAVVLGISRDTPAALTRWREKQDLPFDLLSDPEHVVLEKYGAWGEKKLYGKTSFGIIRSHWIIDPQGKIAAMEIKVSPDKSVQLVEQHFTG